MPLKRLAMMEALRAADAARAHGYADDAEAAYVEVCEQGMFRAARLERLLADTPPPALAAALNAALREVA